MRYIFRLLLILVVLAGIAVVGYSYVGDLSPTRSPVESPVTLDVN